MRAFRIAVLRAALILVGASLAGWVAAFPHAPRAAAGSPGRALHIGAIPDQDVSRLNRLYRGVAEYLSSKLGFDVRYIPSIDYAAVVTAFRRGDLDLAWFGGLTAVQAMEAVPGARAIVQRPRDAQFHSVFIVQAALPAKILQDLKGASFTFGSESSTSGHLMPRYFLMQAGIQPERDFATVSYSGSHDKTYKLVEAGAFQAGALNEAVWEAAVREGRVDISRVRVLYVTPAYYDYTWVLRPDVDDRFGPGTAERIRQAFLSMGPQQKEILDLFATDRFIETNNANYQAIREVAEVLGILRP